MIVGFHFLLLNKYHLLHTLKIKHGIYQQDLKIVELFFVKSNFFYPLEGVDRVSETQLQVGEN